VTARLYIEAEEARRAALLEHGRTRLDLQLSEIKNGVLTQRVAEKTKQIDLLADKLSTNEDSCLIEDFARSTGDILGYGRDGLFRYLRRKGFLLRRPANDPSATMVADGYFIKEMNSTFVDHKSGVVRQSSTTKLTKAGYDWLLKFMSRDPDTTLNRMLAKPEYKGHAIQCLRSYELYRDDGHRRFAPGRQDAPQLGGHRDRPGVSEPRHSRSRHDGRGARCCLRADIQRVEREPEDAGESAPPSAAKRHHVVTF
jgi:phage antirepressor YoqD-like protein